MSDESVADALRSEEPLVVIEAAAGCGKTWQAASYARDVAGTLGNQKLLILTHTHAACSVFSHRTQGLQKYVDIKTIDALTTQIAAAYHIGLDLPPDVSLWAWRTDGGFATLAAKVAQFLNAHPMLAQMLAYRYPIIICDEHQDSSQEQHEVVMALHQAGSILRVFGDPMQSIYASSKKELIANHRRWKALKNEGVHGYLETPHRWKDGCPDLGSWICEARRRLAAGKPIDLTTTLPASVQVIVANDEAQRYKDYRLSGGKNRKLRDLVENKDSLLILASQKSVLTSLRPHFRTIPIWEGHTRDALASLLNLLREHHGDAETLAQGLVAFITQVTVGFTPSRHGNRLIQETVDGCQKKTRGMPANIQAIARHLIESPCHIGLARAIALIDELIRRKDAGFEKVRVDLRVELSDAIRLGEYSNADEAFAEISRRRSFARPMPPSRALSTIHKAKGLECDNTLMVACDRRRFGDSLAARCKLYVALSRARRSLTLVISDKEQSPLFRLE